MLRRFVPPGPNTAPVVLALLFFSSFFFVSVFIFIFDRGHVEGCEVVCILLIAHDHVACPILHPVFIKCNILS